MDILQKLREPRVNIMNIDIAIFDLTASYLGIYLTSKYLLGLKRPGLTSALTFLPISYLAHEYFNVNTPLNDAINSRFNDQPNKDLIQPRDPNEKPPVIDHFGNILKPIDFKTMTVAEQMYINKFTPPKDQKFDEENNKLKPVPYEKIT